MHPAVRIRQRRYRNTIAPGIPLIKGYSRPTYEIVAGERGRRTAYYPEKPGSPKPVTIIRWMMPMFIISFIGDLFLDGGTNQNQIIK
jgi:hypothetical protein